MRRWLCLRSGCALLLGIAAALLVAMLPPLPDWTATLPKDAVLREVSSDGRYLVSSVHWPEVVADEIGAVHVWDRTAGMEKPLIAVAIPRGAEFSGWLLSPDEGTLVLSLNRPHDGVVHVFDLASGRKLRSRDGHVDHLFFSSAGKLVYVNGAVVRELDTDREVRSMPKRIDAFAAYDIRGHHGEYGIYYTGAEEEESIDDGEVRVFSWLTGEVQERMPLPGRLVRLEALSRDGRTLYAWGRAPGQDLWSRADFRVLIDLSTRQVHTWHESFAGAEVPLPSGDFLMHADPVLSPDGKYFAWLARTQRPDWLEQWWPIEDEGSTLHIKHWTKGREVAQFRDIQHAVFSPQTTQLVLMRKGGAIEGYAFPLRKPWGLIAAAVLVTALASWSIAWLWSRWRSRTTKGGMA